MVKVITIGCRLNQAEGDQLHSSLTIDHRPLTTDNLIIINTCAVTQSAVKTSWKKIRYYIKNSKLKIPNLKLIVTGCLASLQRDKLLNVSGIDMVLTQDEKTSLLTTVDDNLWTIDRTRPIIKIQDGCPNDCSFCIARIIRGRPKSVPIEVINKEINHYTNLGYQEIVLTGLNLGCYGIDNNTSLINLLQSLNMDSFRIRLSSIEPDTINEELLNLFKSKRLCRHLHIPLQSGDDRVLQIMRRKYNVCDFQKLIDKILSKIPGINIGSDIIVGFPNEDETAFNNTLKLIQELPLGYLHVFPYSTRPGTEAAKLPDKIPSSVKKQRVRLLREISQKKNQLFQKRFINAELEVLVEDANMGITDNYIRIRLPPNKNYQKGKLYPLPIAN